MCQIWVKLLNYTFNLCIKKLKQTLRNKKTKLSKNDHRSDLLEMKCEYIV